MTEQLSPEQEALVPEVSRALQNVLPSWLAEDGTTDDEDLARAIIPLIYTAGRRAGREEAASYVEGAGGVIPGAAVFASLVSGNNMPCMSGDPRDRLPSHKRRSFDDATQSLATAIRNLDKQEEGRGL